MMTMSSPKASERGAPIPESWRGPACAAFDREMARASGGSEYGKATALVSALNDYDEMSFEPSPREQRILASKKDAMDMARAWIQENVLHNPTIKALMYETVRDFDRDTTDPERQAFLAEMRPIMESKQ